VNGEESLGTVERLALDRLKERLERELGPALKKLALFGSRARGDAEEDSDIDVAVVVDGMNAVERDRIFRIISEVELESLVTLSTLVLSLDEYSRLLRRERRLALDIEREGIPL
jgi:predicted nucleotidyltransferase